MHKFGYVVARKRFILHSKLSVRADPFYPPVKVTGNALDSEVIENHQNDQAKQKKENYATADKLDHTKEDVIGSANEELVEVHNNANRQHKSNKKITIDNKNYYMTLQEAEDEDAETKLNNDCTVKEQEENATNRENH